MGAVENEIRRSAHHNGVEARSGSAFSSGWADERDSSSFEDNGWRLEQGDRRGDGELFAGIGAHRRARNGLALARSDHDGGHQGCTDCGDQSDRHEQGATPISSAGHQAAVPHKKAFTLRVLEIGPPPSETGASTSY